MITTTIETITPQVAKEYLKHNTKNRYGCKGNPDTIASLAEDMRSGLWKLNGEPIIFDAGGVLVDGQHRLFACIKAGVSFQSLVVRGVDEDSFSTVDIGLPRKAGQILSLQNAPNANDAAAAITRFYSLIAGSTTVAGNAQRLTNYKKTKTQVVDFYNSHKAIVDIVCSHHNAIKHRGLRFLSSSTINGISLFLIIEKHYSVEKVFSFFDQLMTGNDVENKTILLLRERLLKDKLGQQRMTSWSKFAIIVKAWNCFVSGTEVRQLKISAQEQTPEFI